MFESRAQIFGSKPKQDWSFKTNCCCKIIAQMVEVSTDQLLLRHFYHFKCEKSHKKGFSLLNKNLIRTVVPKSLSYFSNRHSIFATFKFDLDLLYPLPNTHQKVELLSFDASSKGHSIF